MCLKRQVEGLARRMQNGTYRTKDGSFVSERRVTTVKEVAKHIPLGVNTKNQVHNLVDQWMANYASNTVALRISVMAMVTDMELPRVRLGGQEPLPIPAKYGLQILTDEHPKLFVRDKWDDDCFTVTKLAINSCLRPIDAVGISSENISNGMLLVVHQKTKLPVRSELHPALNERIKKKIADQGEVYSWGWRQLSQEYKKKLLTEFVKKLSDGYGFGHIEHQEVVRGKVKKKTLRQLVTGKSLRSTGANVLLELGVPVQDVMAIGGWKSFDIFRDHYLKPNINVWTR